MNRETCNQLFLRIEQWMNTPTSSPTQPNTLRWWVTANPFDKYFFRVVMLLTIASGVYLFGCNSATSTSAGNESAGAEYVGLWQHATSPYLTMTISKKGDQFQIHQMANNKSIPTHPDQLATLHNGLLQFDSGSFFEYHKETGTITSSGNIEFVYRRKQ
jgi:hypothetical protein